MHKNPMFSKLAVGIDLGATKTASVLISREGEVVDSYQSLTNASKAPFTALETIIDHLERYQTDFAEEITGIGLGTPGWHDSENGTITNAVNIGWEDFKLVTELRKRISLTQPILHRTDAIAETLGEYYYGAAKGYSDFVYLGVGSGLGSGYFCNHQLINGNTGMAGGIGHFGYGSSKTNCACGLQGCIEQEVGGMGLTNILTRLSNETTYKSLLTKNQFNDHYSVLAAANKNDPLVIEALSEMGKRLGIVMSIYITILNPGLIVIGGGLGTASFEFIVPPAIKEARKRTLVRYWEKLRIKKSTVFSSAAGAACLVWKHFE